MDYSGRHEDQDLLELVAVIGFSLKFPQDATSAEALWHILVERKSAMSDIPRDRLSLDAIYHPTRHDALPIRGAYFLREDLGVFDADFPSISPAETVASDPNQRILFETSFTAFETQGFASTICEVPEPLCTLAFHQ
ncbi:ketoacyl-synt-domain-containing protein [Viridothelium virens]|uniref:Ketoacyl-synt-domain-containing protein n=1 Tax=Viridothelium virens TaxID=1048519 RepID=A0A6A6GZH6_VIRVR|nr:ketoacyl-synt-domain-containing protein [Viridothelium virens]